MSDGKEGAKVIDLSSLLEEEIGTQEPIKDKFTLEEPEEDFLGLGEGVEVTTEESGSGEAKEELENEGAGDRGTASGGTEEEEGDPGKTGEGPESGESEDGEEDPAGTDDPVEETVKSKEYKESLSKLFDDEITTLIDTDEDGNEVEINIADVEMTKELYETIVANKIEAVREEAKKNTVSTDGISELTRELIEIDRAGGDISTVLKSKETYIDVLDRLDLTNTEHQKQVVTLRYQAEGTKTPEEIEILVAGYEASGKLEEKAEVSDKEIRGAVANQIQSAKTAAIEEQKKQKALLKDYKKELKESLKQFELSDHVKNKIVKLATKENDKGRYEIDETFYSMKNDPKMAAKLMLFLLDNEEYNKQVSKKVKKATQLNTAKKLKIVKKVGTESTTLKASSKGANDKIINLASLNE